MTFSITTHTPERHQNDKDQNNIVEGRHSAEQHFSERHSAEWSAMFNLLVYSVIRLNVTAPNFFNSFCQFFDRKF